MTGYHYQSAFTTECVKLDQECHFILTQGALHNEELAGMNSYMLNITSNTVRKAERNEEKTDGKTTIIGIFNIPEDQESTK